MSGPTVRGQLRTRLAVRNRRFFPGFVPAHEIYTNAAREYAPPGSRVLHLGSGRDALNIASALPDRHVVALDPDQTGLRINSTRSRCRSRAEALPFLRERFDVVLCEHVFEHLEHPVAVLSECARVLKPGGRLLFLTPNRWSYIAMAAAATPQAFHVWYRRRFMGTSAIDTFPTHYLLNTPGTIRRMGQAAGLRLEWIQTFVGWPTYFNKTDWLHRMGVVLHLVIERLPARFHVSLVGCLLRP